MFNIFKDKKDEKIKEVWCDVIKLVYDINQKTKLDLFLAISPHVKWIDLSYYVGGFDVGKQRYILSLDDDRVNLKSNNLKDLLLCRERLQDLYNEYK